MTPLEKARSLARSGNLKAALEELERGGEEGHADCLVDLAHLYLRGRAVPRDLRRSRDYFGRAGELGDASARAIHIAFLGVGVGGAPDFQEAVRRLREAAAADPRAKREVALLDAMRLTPEGDPATLPEPRQLSSEPHVQLFPGLLTPDECRFLIDAAEEGFRPAGVGLASTGEQGYSEVRTCDVAPFTWMAESPAIHAINRRIAAASGTDVRVGEPLQVLRYRPGQEFKPHRDCTEPSPNQRVLTMLVYLNDAYTGGETLFLETGLKVRGEVGDAILFRNADEDGTPDPASLHAGLPVETGEKLLASRWIRQAPFAPSQ